MNGTHTRLAVLLALSALALVACGGSSTESLVGPGGDAAVLSAADKNGPEPPAGDGVCDGCDGTCDGCDGTGAGPGPGDGTCDGCDGTGDGPGPGDGTCDGCDCTCDGSQCTCECPCDGCDCTCNGSECTCECACDGTGPHGPGDGDE
jgi:hypothetical protein